MGPELATIRTKVEPGRNERIKNINFIGIWKTDKGNLVKVFYELESSKTKNNYWIGQHYKVHQDAKPGTAEFYQDEGNCLVSPDGEILIGSAYSIGEKLVIRKRSEEEKGWLL